MNYKKNLYQKTLLLLLIISTIIYLFIPMKGIVSMPFFYTCFGMMILSNYLFFKSKNKINYLDFDTIFIVVYCLVGFTTTFFYNDRNVYRAIFLGFPVDIEYINKSNLLFLIGLQSYMVGGLRPIKKISVVQNQKIIGTNFLVLLIFILIPVFFISGGFDYIRSGYDTSFARGDVGIGRHILLLLVATAMCLIGTEVYNKKIMPSYKISKLALTSMFFLIGILLFAGNRTAASQIFLPILGLYALLFKSIKFKTFIILVLGGIVAMWGVQRFRTEEKSYELTNPVMLILDLTIPMRNTYAGMRYVDKNDYTYGESMVMGVVGIVPFMSSSIKDINPNIIDGSAELLTQYTYDINRTPDEVQIGLGTTIIADVYIAFGLLGVLFLMYFLGFYVNKWTTNALLLNYYSIIILSGMLGNAIFVVRASFVHPLKFVFLAMLLAVFNRFLYRIWKK